MNVMTKLVLTIPMPRLATVEVVRHLVVRVTWSAGTRTNRIDIVDLSPLINSLKFYRPLREDRSLFRTLHLIEGGAILAWGDDDKIDMAADSIEQLAEESMTSDDFRDFLNSNGLTHAEAAALLGYSRRQIEHYLSGEPIPRVVVMACFGLKARKQSRTCIGHTSVEMLNTNTVSTTTDPPPEPPSLTTKVPTAASPANILASAIEQ
jgi:hypothetical protein